MLYAVTYSRQGVDHLKFKTWAAAHAYAAMLHEDFGVTVVVQPVSA